MLYNSSFGSPIINTSNSTENAHNSSNEDCLAGESTTAEVVCKALAYFVILLVSLVGNILVLFISGAPAREARQRSTMGKDFW